MKNFIFVVKRRKSSFFAVVLAGVALNAVMVLLNPLFLKYVFDEGIMKKDFRLFLLMLAGFALISTACRFFNLSYGLRVQKLKNETVKALTSGMLEKYYRLPYEKIMNDDAGYFTSRIYDEPLAAGNATIDLALEITNAAVAFLVSFGLIASLSAKATLMLTLSVPFLVLLAHKYGSAIKRHASDEKEWEGRLRGSIAKAAQAYRSVNIFGMQSGVFARLDAHFDGYIGSSYARYKNTCLHNTLSSIFMSYGEMLVTVVCGYEMIQGRMSFGGYMAFMNAFWMALGNMRVLIQKVPETFKNDALIRRIREFESAPEAVAAPDASGAVALERVHFKYGDKTILSDLSFAVGEGERVLLSGRNGTGKSTIANILSGFLVPQKGAMSSPGVARTSACVSPHHFIPGTVRDNVAPRVLDEGGKRYLETLLRDFDLNGVLDRNPEELSAGQKKKAELIMGLMKDADLYLFDEPLANVDAESKAVIMRRIFERAEGKRLVVVMHGDEEFRGRFNGFVELAERNEETEREPIRAHPSVVPA